MDIWTENCRIQPEVGCLGLQIRRTKLNQETRLLPSGRLQYWSQQGEGPEDPQSTLR
jgi:hypothetical protein